MYLTYCRGTSKGYLLNAVMWRQSRSSGSSKAIHDIDYSWWESSLKNQRIKYIIFKYRLIMRNKIWLYLNRQLGHVESSQWCLFSRFHDDGTTSSQSRAPFPSQHQNRKVLFKNHSKVNSFVILHCKAKNVITQGMICPATPIGSFRVTTNTFPST